LSGITSAISAVVTTETPHLRKRNSPGNPRSSAFIRASPLQQPDETEMGSIPDRDGFSCVDPEVVALAEVLRTVKSEAGLKFIAS
jgi:hypothetical protein